MFLEILNAYNAEIKNSAMRLTEEQMLSARKQDPGPTPTKKEALELRRQRKGDTGPEPWTMNRLVLEVAYTSRFEAEKATLMIPLNETAPVSLDDEIIDIRLDEETIPLDSETVPLGDEIIPLISEIKPLDEEIMLLDEEIMPLDDDTVILDDETEPPIIEEESRRTSNPSDNLAYTVAPVSAPEYVSSAYVPPSSAILSTPPASPSNDSSSFTSDPEESPEFVPSLSSARQYKLHTAVQNLRATLEKLRKPAPLSALLVYENLQ